MFTSFTTSFVAPCTFTSSTGLPSGASRAFAKLERLAVSAERPRTTSGARSLANRTSSLSVRFSAATVAAVGTAAGDAWAGGATAGAADASACKVLGRSTSTLESAAKRVLNRGIGNIGSIQKSTTTYRTVQAFEEADALKITRSFGAIFNS